MTGILADENVPRATILLLRRAGMDVRSASEAIPGATDVAVLALAASESRILLTFDRDFGELIYRQRRPTPGAEIDQDAWASLHSDTSRAFARPKSGRWL